MEVGHSCAARFPEEQRRVLLLQPGLGERVIRRLEEAGYASVEALLVAGVPRALESAGDLHNRCRALQRALAALQAHRALRR